MNFSTYTSQDGQEVGFEIGEDPDIRAFFEFIHAQQRTIHERVQTEALDRPGWFDVQFITHTVWVVPAKVAPMIEANYVEWTLAQQVVIPMPTPPSVSPVGIIQICCFFRALPRKGRPHIDGYPVIDRDGKLAIENCILMRNAIRVSGPDRDMFHGELVVQVQPRHTVKISWSEADAAVLNEEGWRRHSTDWRHARLPEWQLVSRYVSRGG